MTEALVPKMTGQTTSNISITQSDFTSNGPAWMSFDKKTDDFGWYWNNSAVVPHHLIIYFPYVVSVAYLEFYRAVGNTKGAGTIQTVEMYAGNTDQSLILKDSKPVGFTINDTLKRVNFTSPIMGKCIKMRFTADSTYTIIPEMQIFGTKVPQVYLLAMKGKLYTIQNKALKLVSNLNEPDIASFTEGFALSVLYEPVTVDGNQIPFINTLEDFKLYGKLGG